MYGDGQEHSLSYSIANSFDPEVPRRLQLFVQNHNPFANRILLQLQVLKRSNEAVRVKLPMGKAFLQTSLELPHLLVAAGSGISKIKCLTEEILKQKPNAKTNIYWSNRNVNEFYLLDQFKNWAQQHRAARGASQRQRGRSPTISHVPWAPQLASSSMQVGRS